MVGTQNIIASKNSGLNKNGLFQEKKKNVVNPPPMNLEKIYLHSTSSLDSYKISSKQ